MTYTEALPRNQIYRKKIRGTRFKKTVRVGEKEWWGSKEGMQLYDVN
jgi:hypothetical protein